MTPLPGIVIVGAGVIGAATAYSLRGSDLPVFVLEAETAAGTGISSRNSGVIHAGLYYPPGSLKEQFCREGRPLLYDFAQKHAVPHLKTGKFIVADTEEACAQLSWLAEKNRGEVPLHPVDTLPVGIAARRALFSPETGIIDIHAFITRLLDLADAELLYGQKVTAMTPQEDTVRLQVGEDVYEAAWVVNATGMNATDFHPQAHHYYARGSYFRLHIPKNRTLPHLVYPAVPKESPALGIHLTRNIAGEAYLGPDIEWIDHPSYAVDPMRRSAFLTAARRYLPWLEEEHLSPGYAGIRPKLSRTTWTDFRLEQQGRLLHCLGMESPGITAAMAVGRHIARTIMRDSSLE